MSAVSLRVTSVGVRFGPTDSDPSFDPDHIDTLHDGAAARATKLSLQYGLIGHTTVNDFSHSEQSISLDSDKVVAELGEASAFGISPRVILDGPITVLVDQIATDEQAVEVFPALVDRYEALVAKLIARGVSEIQFDEPLLAEPISAAQREFYSAAYRRIAEAGSGIKIVLTAVPLAFSHSNIELVAGLPVSALHLNLVTSPGLAAAAVAHLQQGTWLELGLVATDQTWPDNHRWARSVLEDVVKVTGPERVSVSTASRVRADNPSEIRAALLAAREIARTPAVAIPPADAVTAGAEVVDG